MDKRNKVLISAVILVGLGAGVYGVAGMRTPAVVQNVERVGDAPVTSVGLVKVGPAEFEQSMANRTVIDVRTPEEFAGGHFQGAVVMDFYAADFRTQLDALPREVPYAVYCRSGNRSGQTLSIMREMGFVDVVDLSGGIVAWQADGRTLCTSC